VCVGPCWLGSCRCMCRFMLVGIMSLYVQVHVGWDHVVVCAGSCWLGSCCCCVCRFMLVGIMSLYV